MRFSIIGKNKPLTRSSNTHLLIRIWQFAPSNKLPNNSLKSGIFQSSMESNFLSFKYILMRANPGGRGGNIGKTVRDEINGSQQMRDCTEKR